VHDHWAIYRGSAWEDSDAEGRRLTDAVGLIRVPGHTAEDIATVVGTPEGVIVFTHLWWTATIPTEDPYAEDQAVLHASRARVLEFADVIVPGHGVPFSPSESTPR
jgi:glyoxylase-like metal-dependent hydrolase (beta-lactamase superfamily II)